MILALRRPLSILGFVTGILVAMMTFQNCGQAFVTDNGIRLGAPSSFPQNYSSYGNLPSQALTNYPVASKAASKATATASGTGIAVVGHK